MRNKAMQRKLEDGHAIDIDGMERTDDGDYILAGHAREMALSDTGVDFCDARTEHWVWSIGVNTQPGHAKVGGVERLLPVGTVVASTSTKFYQAEDRGWRCLWLR